MTVTQTNRIAATCLAVALGLAGPAMADDAVSHYAPEPSETLDAAVENFVTYNRMMQEVLEKEELTGQDMERIHELTYTLEVALAKINEEMSALPVVLEEVHLASEGGNPHALRGVADVYLESATKLDR